MDVTRSGPDDELATLRREVARLQAEIETMRAERVALETACHEDVVTGLLNRRGFLRELDRAIAFVRRYGTAVSLFLVDLDAFKPINDRYGHAAGDDALRHAAGVLGANLRASDTVARFGGDEFAVLLWKIDPAFAAGKAEALEARLDAQPFRLGPQPIPVGGSIGVATLGPDDDGPAVLARADAAMYARKTARKALRR